MSSFKSILILVIAATSALITSAAPAIRDQSCIIPSPGNYSIESVSLTGELVGVGQPNTAGFTLVLEKAPPQGNLGVWTVTNDDQGGFSVLNVELGRNVTTVHLVESNLFLPQLPVPGTPATIYAIECAGNGEYVIKAIDDDLLWTTIPGTNEGDVQQGVGRMEMLPASGSDEQHFLLHAL